LTCRELVEFLADYLAGELATDQRTAFEGHLVECAECLAYLRSYRATVRAAREVCQAGEVLPADVPDALVRAIVAARPRRP
jgi:anti-sigma factor RsiW